MESPYPLFNDADSKYACFVGENLKGLRNGRQWKMKDLQSEFAKLTGKQIAQGRLSQLENGIRQPSIFELRAFCQIYGCVWANILGDALVDRPVRVGKDFHKRMERMSNLNPDRRGLLMGVIDGFLDIALASESEI